MPPSKRRAGGLQAWETRRKRREMEAVATPLEHAIEDMADVDVVKHFVDNLVDTAASDLHDSIDLCELDSRDATDRGSQHNAIDWHRYINDIISKHGTPRNPSSCTVTPDED